MTWVNVGLIVYRVIGLLGSGFLLVVFTPSLKLTSWQELPPSTFFQ
jgi:hypothetical protein